MRVVVFLGTIILSMLVSVDAGAAGLRCFGIALLRDGQTPVVLRAERHGDNEKKLWIEMLFEDFLPLEKHWEKAHPGRVLTRVLKFTVGPVQTHAKIRCFRGNPDSDVATWPAATYPAARATLKSPAPGGKISVPSALTWGPDKIPQVGAYEWKGITRRWVSVPFDGAVWDCKKELLYRQFNADHELESTVHRLEMDQPRIRGPESFATSEIERALRDVAGTNFHLVGYGGTCWASGTAKPSTAPTGWSGMAPW